MDDSLAAATGGLIASIVIYAVIIIGLYVWISLAFAAVFRKAGASPWKGWVPVVREWQLFKLAGMSPAWAIVLYAGPLLLSVVTFALAGGFIVRVMTTATTQGAPSDLVGFGLVMVFVPMLLTLAFSVLQLVIMILMVHRITLKFGLGSGYTVLGVFLYPVWASILAWGQSQWVDHAEPAPVTEQRFAPPPTPEEAALNVAPTPATNTMWAPPPAPVAPKLSTPAAQSQLVEPAAAVPSAGVAPVPTVVDPHPTELTGSSEIVGGPAPMSAVNHAAGEFDGFADAENETPEPAAAASAASDELEDHTVLASRRHRVSELLLPTGNIVPLTGDIVLIGRSPEAPAGDQDAQLVSVIDVTKTISKTHARLSRDGERWLITDLESTNGVILFDSQGVATEVAVSSEISGRFMLGDAEFSLNTET